MASSSDLLLPGQPMALPRGPLPKVGEGLYERSGQIRASVVGVPQRDGPVIESSEIAFSFVDMLLGRPLKLKSRGLTLLLPTPLYSVLSLDYRPRKPFCLLPWLTVFRYLMARSSRVSFDLKM